MTPVEPELTITNALALTTTRSAVECARVIEASTDRQGKAGQGCRASPKMKPHRQGKAANVTAIT